MGRAGRGGGGGSRSHSSGGSRGFSSHSSGGSHRSGYSSRSHSSSHSYSHSHSHDHYRPGGYHVHYHGGYHSPYYRHYGGGPNFYYFGNGGDSGMSFAFAFKTIFYLLIIIIIAGAISDSSGGSEITRSTVEREKLNSSSIVETDGYYIDQLGWITNSRTLENGMEYFYKKTGVQPFLYITDNIAGEYKNVSEKTQEEYGNAIYDALFEDEAHLLLVFCEKNDVYTSFCIVGNEAKTVIDDEAREILLDYIDSYYYSDYDENQFFAKSFINSADRIMKVTPNYFVIILIGVIIIVIIVLLFKWWKAGTKSKLDRMKAAQDILNSDLHEFGDSAEELAKKYDSD